MIRVNLLRHLGATAPGAPASAAAPSFDSPSMSGEDANRRAALKFVAILLAPIAVYVYQRVQVSAEESAIQDVRTKAQKIQEQVAALGPVGPKVEKFQADQKRLTSQLGALKGLSRARLREVKALNAIQDVMPQKTWLSRIKIEGGAVSLVGYSGSDDGYAELQKAVEASVFHDVEPKSTTQEAGASGPLQKFEIEFKIGRPEKQEQ